MTKNPDPIFLVETVLFAKKLEEKEEIKTKESYDLEAYADAMKAIAIKGEEAFNSFCETVNYGGWDAFYKTVEAELKKEFGQKKFFVYLTRYYSPQIMVEIEAKDEETAKDIAAEMDDAGKFDEEWGEKLRRINEYDEEQIDAEEET